jgi:hypothetical protein
VKFQPEPHLLDFIKIGPGLVGKRGVKIAYFFTLFFLPAQGFCIFYFHTFAVFWTFLHLFPHSPGPFKNFSSFKKNMPWAGREKRDKNSIFLHPLFPTSPGLLYILFS